MICTTTEFIRTIPIIDLVEYGPLIYVYFLTWLFSLFFVDVVNVFGDKLGWAHKQITRNYYLIPLHNESNKQKSETPNERLLDEMQLEFSSYVSKCGVNSMLNYSGPGHGIPATIRETKKSKNRHTRNGEWTNEFKRDENAGEVTHSMKTIRWNCDLEAIGNWTGWLNKDWFRNYKNREELILINELRRDWNPIERNQQQINERDRKDYWTRGLN